MSQHSNTFNQQVAIEDFVSDSGLQVQKCWKVAFNGYCISDLCIWIPLNVIYALLNKTFTVYFPPAAELQFQASES